MSLQEIEEHIIGIIQLVEYQRLETCLGLSSAVILVYDYIVTFDLEVSLIWSHHSGWTWTSILFMFNRYLPFLSTANSLWHGFTSGLTLDACEQSFQVTGWLFLATITTAEIILTIRTWAVWQRNRTLTIVVSIVFVAVWGPNIAIMWIFLKSMEFGPIPYPGYQGCNIVKSSQIMAVTWALLVVYETVIFILMACRGYISYCNGGNSALFNVVYREGVVYYFYLFVLSLVNIIVISSHPRYIFILASSEHAIHAILASRMILPIRELASRDPFSSWELSTTGSSENYARPYQV
ncbi:hypothetical protein CCMSSC00406_0007973 [Pleurotus cornucopiae]|uniref:Uncharacterized protein n=1 Tax=Pleurotus cornucopiae TaxID=5321 RepID=A0ACB7IKL7_PLECO|nr:hypothetical protein CCMSSC00406_0007973 [Pleurotus cornucopiae]